MPARGAPLPPAGPNSVFAVGQGGKPARRVAPALDPDSVLIQDGIPVPARSGAGGNRSQALLERMKPGQCVDLCKSHAHTLKTTATKLGMTSALRRIGDDLYRVWRLT